MSSRQPRHKHDPPSDDDHKLWRLLLAGVVQTLFREGLEVILREWDKWWRGGPRL
jgi:hypothetical protein